MFLQEQNILAWLSLYYSYDAICWLRDKNCANVALGPLG